MEISVDKELTAPATSSAVKVKVPRRILHFSDGVYEEYSTDEEEPDSTQKQQAVIDPSSLTWGPWFYFKAWSAGTSTLTVAETIGEYLASFFGITTPRYQFEIDEYHRRLEKERVASLEPDTWVSSQDESVVTMPLKQMSSSARHQSVETA